MKKKLLALFVALTLICSMFATISVSAASDTTLSMQSLGGTTGWDAYGYPGIYAVKFGFGSVLSLGNINLADYDTIEVTYASDPNYFVTKTGAMEMNACFAVYSVSRSVGWPAAGGEHNAEGLLAKADTAAGPGGVVAWKVTERKVSIDVSAVDYSGPVYLSHYNPIGHEALVVGIKLIAKTGGAVTPPPATYDAKINIKLMNKSIWTGDTTIIYDDTYTSQNSSKWHKSAICTYSDTEGAYVVTQIIGTDVSRGGYTLAPGQILIDSCGTALDNDAAAWATVQVGSLVYLEGVDLNAGTVEAGAFAGIVNKDGVQIPETPEIPDPPISAIRTSIDFSIVDAGGQDLTGGAGGDATTYTFPGSFAIEHSIAFGGWAATPNGVAKYQYSIDGENFYDITDATISARPDLAGQPHEGGHSTAGFVVTIPVTAFNDGQNNLTIRLIDTQDGYFDIIKATVNADNPAGAQIPGGDSDDDQNNNNNNNNNDNVGTNDSVAVVFVMMVAVVAMAAVVIKRRKETV